MTTTTNPFRALPERPSIEQLRNQAKDLFRAHKQADRRVCATLRRLRRLEGHSDEQILGAALTLSDVQFALAMDYGLGSWPELKYKVELLRGERTLGTVRREGEHVAIEGLPKIGFAISGRCSYAGALAAALAVTKQPYTYDQIMAYSGLAFRVRWFRSRERPDWCPSSAVGEFPLELQAVSEATGWLQKATARWDADAAMTDLLPAIERSIDRGVPVLGYPSLDNLDLGIIYGYEPDAEQRKLRWLD
jgi:hypothetical protein